MNIKHLLPIMAFALGTLCSCGGGFGNFWGEVSSFPAQGGSAKMSLCPTPHSASAPKSFGFTMKGVCRPIEEHFRLNGPSAVGSLTIQAPNIDKVNFFTICYPMSMASDTEKYPVVVMVNGSGVPASVYMGIFEHLASWGFIVVGNEDGASGKGDSTSSTLNYILSENFNEKSPFHNRIDIDNIGVAGHSQGGAGTFNAITAFSNGSAYKAAFAMSPTHSALAASAILKCPYDISKVKIPIVITASTSTEGMHDAKAEGSEDRVCDISDMLEEQAAIRSNNPDLPVIVARLSDSSRSHGDNLMESEPYLAAWFSYYLKGDLWAGEAFFGDNPEIANNPRWQDVNL